MDVDNLRGFFWQGKRYFQPLGDQMHRKSPPGRAVSGQMPFINIYNLSLGDSFECSPIGFVYGGITVLFTAIRTCATHLEKSYSSQI